MSENAEPYIDDEDLRELLLDYLGDDVPEEEIQKILKAASDENISEEDFDKLLDDFILNHRP
jgi:Ca2+-binding EF-hand superfamily protein